MPFDELFDAEYATMLRLAHLLGAADPENIAQEAFCRVHARWDELADRERAGGYLRTTVVNLCRSAGRRRAVERRHTFPAGDETAPGAEATALDRVATERLLAAVGTLSPRHREALVLRFWLDLSERQMSEAMGISAGAVKSYVSRGLAQLRDVLTTDGGGSDG